MIFGSPKKKITEREFDKMQNRLYSAGFNQRDRERVRHAFLGDLHEHTSREQGIDELELDDRIKMMRERPKDFGFSSGQVDTLEKIMKEHL